MPTYLSEMRLDHAERDHSFIELVQRALTSVIAGAPGYRMEVKTLCSVTVNNAGRSRVHLVHLSLTEKGGRPVEVVDVGSGVGFVIPVVIAIAYGNACIQQPELHLHPMMQSWLGDVLAQAVNARPTKWRLIETHSEQFILRLLRRIRNTSRNKKISKDLQMRPEQLCVLYFDPLWDDATKSNYTKVTQLRVDSDGNFLDKWPRGFFSERDEDIFDE